MQIFKKNAFFGMGDVNAFFGLFLNNLTNFIVLSSLLIGIGIPASLVFSRVIPAVAMATLIGSIFYFIFAYRLSKKENRSTVTCLPTGVSVPHMFLIVFIVVLPVLQKTGDPVMALNAAVAWAFFEGIIEISGAFVGHKIRKFIPRSALLGSLLGVSLIFIVLRPVQSMMEFPLIGFITFAIVLLGYLNKRGYFGKIPIGLIIIVVGTIISLITGHSNLSDLANTKIELSLPNLLMVNYVDLFSSSWIYIATAIPFGIYNFLETMDNLESASVAGDDYDTKNVMLTDGFTTILSCFFGGGFPTAVYIGHPGWKAMGGTQSYTLLMGIALFLVASLNLMHFFAILIPEVALLPILIFIGFSIAEQTFNETPKNHTPAIIIALFPWIASWGLQIVDSTLLIGNLTNNNETITNLLKNGVSYVGLTTLSNGAILISLLWASIVAFVIDDKLKSASIVCLMSALFSFVGFIHASGMMFNASPNHSLAYVMLAILFYGFSLKNKNI